MIVIYICFVKSKNKKKIKRKNFKIIPNIILNSEQSSIEEIRTNTVVPHL